MARSQEISGGSVRELGSQLKLAAMQAKEGARASKTEQRTRELEGRQLQLAAMVSALELANRAIQANAGNAGRSDTDENDQNHTARDEIIKQPRWRAFNF